MLPPPSTQVHLNLPRDLGAQITLTASGAGTYNGPDIYSEGEAFIQVYTYISAIGGSPSMTVSIQSKDPVSGQYTTIGSGAALTGTGTQIIHLGAALASPNINDPVPFIYRVQAAISGTTPSITGTISLQKLDP